MNCLDTEFWEREGVPRDVNSNGDPLCTKPVLLRGRSRKSAIKLFFIKQGKTIVQGFILNAKLKSLIFDQFFLKNQLIFANLENFPILIKWL